MERGLAVVQRTSDTEKRLLREADTYAGCNDAPLHVLRVVSPEEYQSVESAEVTSDFDRSGYEDPATSHFDEEITAFVEDALEEPGTVETVVKVADEGDRVDTVLDAAAERDCDHVFLVGKRRSPTGKALFGDLTQDIILEFDGTVTLAMD
jgi:nucleotide-binding universal stress UspA family protein